MLNGAQKGGFYSNSARTFRCGGVNSNRMTIVHNGIGFRLNGVYRGGRFGWHGYTSRCGGARFQNTHSNRESGIGFRLCKLFHVEQK